MTSAAIRAVVYGNEEQCVQYSFINFNLSWENTASQALARRVGFERYGADLHFT